MIHGSARVRNLRIKPVHVALAAVLVLLVSGAGLVLLLIRAARQAPAFYAAAVARPPEEQKAAGQRFEQRALVLHNELHSPGRRSVRFTEEEINGWLAAELPVKFPQALPKGVADPRVAIEPGRLQLAMRMEHGAGEAIVFVSGEVFLSSEPNEIAVRLKRAQIGALPLPLAQIRTRLEQAGHSRVRLRWSEMGGDPVALVKLFLDSPNAGAADVVLEAIELGAGELTIAWRVDQAQVAAGAEAIVESATKSAAERTIAAER
jgi:hypothetical protein